MPIRHPRGCDLSRVKKATEVPKVDLKTVLAVDSSNPFLRALRIEQGLLKVEAVPAGLHGVKPAPPAVRKEVK